MYIIFKRISTVNLLVVGVQAQDRYIPCLDVDSDISEYQSYGSPWNTDVIAALKLTRYPKSGIEVCHCETIAAMVQLSRLRDQCARLSAEIAILPPTSASYLDKYVAQWQPSLQTPDHRTHTSKSSRPPGELLHV